VSLKRLESEKALLHKTVKGELRVRPLVYVDPDSFEDCATSEVLARRERMRLEHAAERATQRWDRAAKDRDRAISKGDSNRAAQLDTVRQDYVEVAVRASRKTWSIDL
jgi:hypothetical protein